MALTLKKIEICQKCSVVYFAIGVSLPSLMEFAMIKRFIQIFMLAVALGFSILSVTGCTTSVSDDESIEDDENDGRYLYGSNGTSGRDSTTTRI